LSPVGDQALNGVIATGAGILLAVLLLGPTAVVQYRRDGRLGAGDLLTLVAAAVYGLALWTYTLLPFPYGARDQPLTASVRGCRR
jgi:hypothetical protein